MAMLTRTGQKGTARQGEGRRSGGEGEGRGGRGGGGGVTSGWGHAVPFKRPGSEMAVLFSFMAMTNPVCPRLLWLSGDFPCMLPRFLPLDLGPSSAAWHRTRPGSEMAVLFSFMAMAWNIQCVQGYYGCQDFPCMLSGFPLTSHPVLHGIGHTQGSEVVKHDVVGMRDGVEHGGQ